MGDANGTVGSRSTEAVGSSNPEQEDPNGCRLHEIMLEHGLWAPSTFKEAWSGGQAATWFPADGGDGQRIDYIAIPAAWRRGRVCATNPSNIDVLTARLDHVPTTVEVEVDFTPAEPLPRRRATPCERASAPNPDNFEIIQRGLAAAPFVNWSVDVHTHLASQRPHTKSARKPWL